jgi:hypothetical protein
MTAPPSRETVRPAVTAVDTHLRTGRDNAPPANVCECTEYLSLGGRC